MSGYGRSFDDAETVPTSEEMESMMTEKAHELFKVCDTEEKGFITKRDMQRLQSELPLSPDQLEHVFDSLDDDGNGYLTLEEFTEGFGSFLGLKPPPGNQRGEMEGDSSYMDNDIDPAEEEQNFKQMMDNLGATNLYDDESTIQALWCRLRRDDPDMASSFEDFMYRMSNEIRKSKTDFDTLEGALRSKTSAHDEEVRKLYEEMEIQIKQEKERVLNEERAKERQLREAMELELSEKDKQLQELLSKHSEMEDRLGFLNTIETETKIENEKLAKEKEEVEELLMKSQSSLEESQAYIDQLRQQNKSEKRERARAAIQLSEGIAVERETLVKQLDLLKNMNRKLQDEKDEADIRWRSQARARRHQGGASWRDKDPRSENISIHKVRPRFFNNLLSKYGSGSYSPDSTRGQPVGADELADSGIQSHLETPMLQRVFKVVFVGDSGVGKSSFIHRFCTSYFKSTYAATIGVDFRIRNLNIEGQTIVLQLWDTAGQERFRSITKQYFRKADGVVIMYDVTSETSFTNVRNWMASVQDGVSEDAVLVLLGNKNDLPEEDADKAVKMKDGSRLADEYGTLFYETSALSGENVDEAMEGVARVLKDKEDVLIEKSFRLEDSPKKKGCCT